MNRTVFDISTRSILKILGIILGFWFLYYIRDIVLLFFFVFIIVMALAPIVDKWQQFMSRGLAITLLFVIILAVISLIISLLIPPLVSQSAELANNLPTYAAEIQTFLAQPNFYSEDLAQRAIQSLSAQLSNLSSSLVDLTLGFLNGILTFLTIMALSAYLLTEEQGIRKLILSLLPHERKESIANAVNKVSGKLGAWLRGQLLLMLIIGGVTMVWTSIMGLPYWLPLSLFAGLTEVLPFVGPVIGGLPIVLIALIDSPIKALIALVIIGLTQQLESNFIVPKVMQKSVGLSPVIIILALLIGAKLFGMVGAILAVPVAATLAVVVQDWPKLSKAIEKTS